MICVWLGSYSQCQILLLKASAFTPSNVPRRLSRAYLTFHQVLFERRHDLNYLIDLCISLEADFAQFRILADMLTPYAVEFRYPDALASLSIEPVREGVDAAGLIYTFVVELLGS